MIFSKYLRTIKYLKPVQVYFQLKYRLFGYNKVKVKKYPRAVKKMDIFIDSLDGNEKYIDRFQPRELLNNKIKLLNESVDWKISKWKYNERTHLWNFNLHYFEYGIALAVEYRKTNNRAYYEKLVTLYKDWKEECFYKQVGDAWHPYTISLRLKNLLIISSILNVEWTELISSDIYVQYKFLIANQEKNLLGNHYFENIVTIYLCSVFFNEDKIQKKFKKKIEKEIKEQILPDGMHFERSFMYHNLILEDLIRIWLVSEGVFKNVLTDTIARMCDCVFSFEEDERIPAFNDSGSNVSKSKCQLLNATRELTKYLPKKKQLTYAGYYKLENDEYSIIMDVGEFAPTYISGHGQCDALSIEIYYRGYPVLVNSGTYQYQTELRSYFRGTASHNTLQAADNEQSECWGEHRTINRVKIIETIADNEKIAGCIEDYKGNKLKRRVELNEQVEIYDSSSVAYKSYWHIHPSNTVNIISGKKIEIIVPSGSSLFLLADKEFNVLDCWYSEEFGKVKKSICFKNTATKTKIIKRTIEEED